MKRTTLAVVIAAICAGMSMNTLAQASQGSEQAASGGSNEQQETSGAGAQGAQGAQSQTSTEDGTSGTDARGDDAGTDVEDDTVTQSDGESQGQMDDVSRVDSDGTTSSDGAQDEDTSSDDSSTGESQGQMDTPTSADESAATDTAPSDESTLDDDTDSAGQMDEGNQGRSPNAMEDPDNREPDPSLAENDTQGGLMSLTISDVQGMSVVNQQDEEIGDVDRVVEHNDSGDLYAVVSIGGFWGFGATNVALALQEIQLEDDQLVMQTPYGSDEIESATEEYNEDNYSQIDGDMQVGELANHPN